MTQLFRKEKVVVEEHEPMANNDAKLIREIKSVVQEAIAPVQRDVSTLTSEFALMKTDVSALKTDVSTLRTTVDAIDQRTTGTGKDVKEILRLLQNPPNNG